VPGPRLRKTEAFLTSLNYTRQPQQRMCQNRSLFRSAKSIVITTLSEVAAWLRTVVTTIQQWFIDRCRNVDFIWDERCPERMLIRVKPCNNTSELSPAGSSRARWCSRTTFQQVSGSQVKNAIRALRLISSSDTVRPQNKASRIGCTLWKPQGRGKHATNLSSLCLP
jgi:hypothetical protein